MEAEAHDFSRGSMTGCSLLRDVANRDNGNRCLRCSDHNTTSVSQAVAPLLSQFESENNCS